jgi:hypothetical protein
VRWSALVCVGVRWCALVCVGVLRVGHGLQGRMRGWVTGDALPTWMSYEEEDTCCVMLCDTRTHALPRSIYCHTHRTHSHTYRT